MLGRLFPKVIDNDYRGWWLAVWMLAPLILLKLVMGINVSGLNPWISNRDVAINADGFALDSYGTEAASVVMFMFASWGLILFVLSLLGLLVLVRYRAMIPLMYLLLGAEQFGRKAIAMAQPIVKAAAQSDGFSPAFLINTGFMAVLTIGFILSLAPRRAGATEPAEATS
jgi:hypothetical protein